MYNINKDDIMNRKGIVYWNNGAIYKRDAYFSHTADEAFASSMSMDTNTTSRYFKGSGEYSDTLCPWKGVKTCNNTTSIKTWISTDTLNNSLNIKRKISEVDIIPAPVLQYMASIPASLILAYGYYTTAENSNHFEAYLLYESLEHLETLSTIVGLPNPINSKIARDIEANPSRYSFGNYTLSGVKTPLVATSIALTLGNDNTITPSRFKMYGSLRDPV